MAQGSRLLEPTPSCPKCGGTDFGWYKNGKRQPDLIRRCKPCRKAVKRKRPYIYSKEKSQETIIRYREKKDKAVALFGGKCLDCSNIYPPFVFDFHHLEPKEKDDGVAFHSSWEKIEKELKKCVMLCANCHRIRHGRT